MNNGSRYARQIILPEVGEDGQQKLLSASILIVGAGGLCSPSALYLTAAGIGHLMIADADEVRLNNLNRQILYGEKDLGKPKAAQAKKRLQELNSEIEIRTVGRIDESNIHALLSSAKFDAVIDATDNFETRFTVNSACVEKQVPFIYGSVLGFQGQVSIFGHKKGPCYQCIYPEPPLDAQAFSCVQTGVIGVSPGIVGTMQAAEAIKLILDVGKLLSSKMLLIDLLGLNFKIMDLSRDPKCPICK